MTATAVLGSFCLLIWLYLLFGRGGFWRINIQRVPHIPLLADVGTADLGTTFRIIAIIPARNEAEVIGRSITSLLQQTSVDLRVVIVDDNSTDGTAGLARQAALAAGKEISVIIGKPLPPGWSGKLWAVQQGIDHARQFNPDYLLLTDADIEHTPSSVSLLATIAKRGSYDLASYMAKLECNTLAERLLIPPFVYFFLQLYPPGWISDPRKKTAGAAGGCILIRPCALDDSGAMESIRHEIIDDCALAGEVKRNGGRVWLGLTGSATSIRLYQSISAIERMIARSAFNQLGHSLLLLIVAIVGLLLTYVVPIALLFGPLRWLGILACALMYVSYFPMVRYYGLNPLWTLTLPLAALFYMVATLDSAFRYWTGRGGEWKGRTQDRKATESSA
jgi:hopene-associated glycosyltransferase HpnB